MLRNGGELADCYIVNRSAKYVAVDVLQMLNVL